MSRTTFALILLCITVLGSALFVLLRPYTFALLEPKGSIASDERALIVHAVLLMLVVVVPVFILAFTIAWRYRAGNTKATYAPNWEHSKMEEFVWWVIPFEIILVISALIWTSTHELDPYRPIVSANAPLEVQVVALDWKWLFIYPSLGIASVNELAFPVDTPLELYITADAPMNSFWIPQLGGQVYAMTGMTTRLHLIADELGVYGGSSANYSGEGFAQMKFAAKALSQSEFGAWVESVKQNSPPLTLQTYQELAAPGTTTPLTYTLQGDALYNSIVSKFH